MTILAGIATLTACSKEIPPTSVETFVEDPVLLDATLARCDLEDEESFDDQNCVNARRAVEKLWREHEAMTEQQREQQFERKRALLRAQADREAEALAKKRQLEEEAEQARLYGGTTFDEAAGEGATAAAAGDESARETATPGDQQPEPRAEEETGVQTGPASESGDDEDDVDEDDAGN